MAMTFQQKLISELTQLDQRQGGTSPYRIGIYLNAADDVLRLIRNGRSPESAFAEAFTPSREMHRIARKLKLKLGVDRGQWIILSRSNPSMPTAGRSKIDIINDAAAGQYQKIYELHGGKQRKILLDMTTARAIVTVYRALSPANQEKFLRYPISRMGQIAWTLLGKKNPSPMHVASLLFDQRVFTPAQAKAWAHTHGFKYGLVETPGPHGQYLHLPQHHAGRVTRIVSLGGTRSGIRAIVARNPSSPSFHYVYRPGVLDRTDPTVMQGRPIAPNTLVRVLAKRPAGGKAIRGWGRTFAWIADAHGNEQIVFRRALQKTSATGY